MKVGFIRALWGIHEHQGRRFYLRRTKIDNDIELVLHDKFHPDFITYVFGKDNYEYLKSRGFKCSLIHPDPIVWDMDTQQFRHKFEVFKKASEDFDRFVFLDWDMMFVKPMPSDFWDTLSKKADFQAIMRIYKKQKAFWRTEQRRLIPCGSFMYIADKTIPSKLIQYWENMNKPWSEELVVAKYIDDLMGKFDLEKYWETYEPPYFALQPIYSPEKMSTKIRVIEHFNARGVSGYLNIIKRSATMPIDSWMQKAVRIYT